ETLASPQRSAGKSIGITTLRPSPEPPAGMAMMRGTSTARSGVPSGQVIGYGGGAGALRKSPLGMPFLTHVAIAVTCLSVSRGSSLSGGNPGPCVANHGGIVRACVAATISLPLALTSSYDNSENGAGVPR